MDGPRDATTTGTAVSEGDSVIPDLEFTHSHLGLKSKKNKEDMKRWTSSQWP